MTSTILALSMLLLLADAAPPTATTSNSATPNTDEPAENGPYQFGVPIVDAIHAGDIAYVRRYLAGGGDPNAVFGFDPCHGDVHDSLLSIAIEAERPAIARLLLAYGASPHGVRTEHEFPLWWAAASGDVELVDALIARGARINMRRREYRGTPLETAIYFDHPEVVRRLLQRGATTDFLIVYDPHQEKVTPLEFARALGHNKCEQVLRHPPQIAYAAAPQRPRSGPFRRSSAPPTQPTTIVTTPPWMPPSQPYDGPRSTGKILHAY